MGFQIKGNYSELARSQRYAISGSTEKLIQDGEITEEEAKQMMLIQAEVDQMVAERRPSKVEDEEQDVGYSYSGTTNGSTNYYGEEAMEEPEETEDDSYSYSYSGYGGNYGNYRYQNQYDEDEEEEDQTPKNDDDE